MFKIENLHFGYTKNEKVLNDISFDLEKGKILAVVGPSGGGKSSLLRVIAGLEQMNQGKITIQDSDISNLKPEKRKIGMLFQDYALFPHMTVEKNIAFACDSKDKKKRVKELLGLVDMTGFEKRYPHELSGGQQQRVALARTLASDPQLLLLDEPFSNLDTELIKKIRGDMFALIRKLDITTIIVTHNDEDTEFADQKMRIEKGIIQ